MQFTIGINGYGRIGQSVLRAIYASPYRAFFKIGANNDLADIETLTYLTRYDTTHGRFPHPLHHEKDNLFIDESCVRVFNEPDPAKVQWQEMNVDLIMECSGSFSDRPTAVQHIRSGGKKLLFSHPATPEVDATIVYGYNHELLKAEHTVVSNASCTTNCIVPILNLLDRHFGIEHGVTTTIHSAMNDQPVIDSYHRPNLRLSRSALHSIIPVDTSLAKGIDRLMPQLAGRFQCLHVRVPTINVSVMDISIYLRREASDTEINELFFAASQNELKDIVGYTEEPHASVDFNGDPHSAIVDGTQTKVSGKRLLKMLIWFDNEWGFAHRMLDVAHYWLTL